MATGSTLKVLAIAHKNWYRIVHVGEWSGMSLRFRHSAGLGYDRWRGAFSRPIAVEVWRNPRIRTQAIGGMLCVGKTVGVAETAKPASLGPLRGGDACRRLEAQNRGQHPLGLREKEHAVNHMAEALPSLDRGR